MTKWFTLVLWFPIVSRLLYLFIWFMVIRLIISPSPYLFVLPEGPAFSSLIFLNSTIRSPSFAHKTHAILSCPISMASEWFHGNVIKGYLIRGSRFYLQFRFSYFSYFRLPSPLTIFFFSFFKIKYLAFHCLDVSWLTEGQITNGRHSAFFFLLTDLDLGGPWKELKTIQIKNLPACLSKRIELHRLLSFTENESYILMLVIFRNK